MQLRQGIPINQSPPSVYRANRRPLYIAIGTAVVVLEEPNEVPAWAAVPVEAAVFIVKADCDGRAARPAVKPVTVPTVVPAKLVILVEAPATTTALCTTDELVACLLVDVLDVVAVLVLTPLAPSIPETSRLALGVPRPVTRS